MIKCVLVGVLNTRLIKNKQEKDVIYMNFLTVILFFYLWRNVVSFGKVGIFFYETILNRQASRCTVEQKTASVFSSIGNHKMSAHPSFASKDEEIQYWKNLYKEVEQNYEEVLEQKRLAEEEFENEIMSMEEKSLDFEIKYEQEKNEKLDIIVLPAFLVI